MKLNRSIPHSAAIALCILALLYLGYAFFHIATSLAPDFSVLYFSTKNLLHHANPYTNKNLYTFFAYPPVTTLLYIPFTFLPYVIAQFIFLSLSIVSIGGLVYTSLRIICGKIAVNSFLIVLALFVFAFPTKFTIGMGQSNLIALLFILVGYWYKDKKHGVCVILTAIAVILKPVLLFVLFYYLLRKQVHILISTMIVGLIFLAMSVILYGASIHMYYIQHVIPELMVTTGRDVYYNQGILGFVSRIVTDIPTRQNISGGAILLMFGSLMLLARKKVADNDLLAVILSALVLIDTLSWQHHFVFLLFPFIHYYVRYYDSEEHTSLGILFYLTYILVALNIRSPSLVSGITTPLILSHQFAGATLLYSLLYIQIWRSQKNYGNNALIAR
ncbi:MAG: hypothetical protein RI947_1606 [Candidatus Parcubacteria bacterium]|jgi:hypothetical protein